LNNNKTLTSFQTAPHDTMFHNSPTFLGYHMSPHVDYHGVSIVTQGGIWHKDNRSEPWKLHRSRSIGNIGGRLDMSATNNISISVKRQPHEVVGK